jgi:hypothetical protein
MRLLSASELEGPVSDGQAHFQLFAQDDRSDIRWRLLSANNRELGRGCETYRTAENCMLAIKHLIGQLDDLVPHIRRREGNLWQWSLVIASVPIVIGAHAYDRQVRSQEAASRFLRDASDARLGERITLTGSRRWVRPPVGGASLGLSTATPLDRPIRLSRP